MPSEMDPGRWMDQMLGLRPELVGPGREDLIRSLVDPLLRSGPAEKTALLGPRLAGTSHLVKVVYRRLFTDQQTCLPLYYDLDRFFPDAAGFCRDHAASLVRQYLAFRAKDPALLGPAVVSAATVRRLVRERADTAAEELLAELDRALEQGSAVDAVRLTLSAAAHLGTEFGGGAVLILDHLHRIETMPWAGPLGLAPLLAEVLGSAPVSVLVTGLRGPVERRFLGLEAVAGRMHVRLVDPLGSEVAARLFGDLCRLHDVVWEKGGTEAELARFQGIPFYMEAVIRRAREQGRSLKSGEVLRDLYGEEVAGGDIARYFHALLNRAFPGPLVRFGTWPHGHRSALAVTGDIDALTFWDFVHRMRGA